MADQTTTIRSESTVTIAAPPAEVWRAITDPALIKQWFFGTDTVTDWKVGSPIVHRGEMNGKAYEDKGTVLAFEPETGFSHSHWSSGSGRPDRPENYERITYRLTPAGQATKLTIGEENLPGDAAKATSEKAWAAALGQLKALVEGKD